ncbi:hypothetical protein PRIC1_010490 [Phytophthora ramorum]
MDIETDFKGTRPSHGNCIARMAASGSISAPAGVDRRDLATFADDDPVWDTIARQHWPSCEAPQLDPREVRGSRGQVRVRPGAARGQVHPRVVPPGHPSCEIAAPELATASTSK